MKDMQKEFSTDDEMEARTIMAEEWNQFQVPMKIDNLITKLMYWEEKDEHQAVLIIMDDFFTQECYARKCIWFSSANYHRRIQEEKKGAFYQSAFCKDSCVYRDV